MYHIINNRICIYARHLMYVSCQTFSTLHIRIFTKYFLKSRLVTLLSLSGISFNLPIWPFLYSCPPSTPNLAKQYLIRSNKVIETNSKTSIFNQILKVNKQSTRAHRVKIKVQHQIPLTHNPTSSNM